MKLLSFLPALTGLSLASALLIVAPAAHAEVPPDCSFPDDPSYMCFRSESATVAKSSANIPFDNGLRTGWLNCEAPPGDKTPCGQQPSFKCNTLGACLEVAMDQSKLDLSMQHNWDVYWPQVGQLQMVPRKPIKEGGLLQFTYKLEPTFSIMIDAFNNKWFFAIDPTQILDIIDNSGTVKDFESSASGKCAFSPFAFDNPVVCPGKATNGTIFSFELSDIGIDIDEYVKIALGLDAGTTDVTFSWITDEISVKGGDNPITKDNPSTNIPYTGGDEVSATVGAKGKLTYKGSTFLAPTIEVTEIAGFPIKFKWPIDVGAELPFEGTIPISLNQTSVNIQLPDLTLIASLNSAGAFDFGNVTIGEEKTKTVTLKNYGAMISKGEVTSSQASLFKPKNGSFQLDPSGEIKVDISFIPKQAGKAEATVYIKSNDPDQPEQTLKVSGVGVQPGEDPPPEGEGGSGGSAGKPAGSAGSAGKKVNTGNPDADETSASDGGCGCRAVGPEGNHAWGGLAVAALAFAAGRRRRRLATRRAPISRCASGRLAGAAFLLFGRGLVTAVGGEPRSLGLLGASRRGAHSGWSS